MLHLPGILGLCVSLQSRSVRVYVCLHEPYVHPSAETSIMCAAMSGMRTWLDSLGLSQGPIFYAI